MYTPAEIAAFPSKPREAWKGASMVTVHGWTTDKCWAVRGVCTGPNVLKEAPQGIADGMKAVITGPENLKPIREVARVPAHDEDKGACSLCGGSGIHVCGACNIKHECGECDGKGCNLVHHSGSRWYETEDGIEIVLSDDLAVAILDGRGLDLFGTASFEAIFAKLGGDVVAVIMPLREAGDERPAMEEK